MVVLPVPPYNENPLTFGGTADSVRPGLCWTTSTTPTTSLRDKRYLKLKSCATVLNVRGSSDEQVQAKLVTATMHGLVMIYSEYSTMAGVDTYRQRLSGPRPYHLWGKVRALSLSSQVVTVFPKREGGGCV